MDCARQYAALFSGSFRVTTVYLTGSADAAVEAGSGSDEVIFLGYRPRDIRGLKLNAMRDIRRLVAQGNYRFCIAHRFKPIYIALLATSLPVIGVHHAFGVYDRPARRLLVSLFRKRLLLLGVSNAVRDQIRERLPTWTKAQIATLYNRIDVKQVRSQLLSRQEARAALALADDAWIVGNAGRLHPDKDQKTLIRGFAQALPLLPPQSLLAIMGSGRLEQELKQLANELGLGDRVRFLGQIAEGRRYFKAFDVFALSSDHEPFGMVVLEAMAADVPIVSSDCGGAPEILGTNGHLFQQGDPDSLAEALLVMAGLEPGVLADLRTDMAGRLDTLFSDHAVKPQFFALLEESGICPSSRR